MSGHISKSTIARMAGNIASGVSGSEYDVVRVSVRIARAIAEEVERTEPKRDPQFEELPERKPDYK